MKELTLYKLIYGEKFWFEIIKNVGVRLQF